jgi:hypothetical protein
MMGAGRIWDPRDTQNRPLRDRQTKVQRQGLVDTGHGLRLELTYATNETCFVQRMNVED